MCRAHRRLHAGLEREGEKIWNLWKLLLKTESKQINKFINKERKIINKMQMITAKKKRIRELGL